jgi:ArsR family transcriptional regulator
VAQQLAVLRRSGILSSKREGSTAIYALASGDVADLMGAARRILTEMPARRNKLLAELRGAESLRDEDVARLGRGPAHCAAARPYRYGGEAP